MYKSQFLKIYAYDWFCGPGSHIQYNTLYYIMVQKHYSIFAWTFSPWALDAHLSQTVKAALRHESVDSSV